MNTNQLKKFAQATRTQLLQQVSAKLEFVLSADSAELREKTIQIQALKEALQQTSKTELIEKVAYTWFNRFMALRFMDANDYQPTGIRILSPREGYTLPEILDEAKRGHVPEEYQLDRQRMSDLLDGRLPSSNPQNEAFKTLLIAACNQLHSIFPFLFERINHYTELLLPDDLTSEFSIVHAVVEGMTESDCQEVEIIGWLYQFYISEEKERLINAKKKYTANEIAPVTQLFTPKWIVQYMVDNTLGQFWKETRPHSKITDGLAFYIKPDNPELIPKREIKSPEEITFFDPCVGSAHILCYAFDILHKIYEEEGYNANEIPELILTKNLYGIDIDDRSAQLAGFALMMKGRQYYRRFLKKGIQPNVTAFKNVASNPQFNHAKVLGSLIRVNQKEVESITIDHTSLFSQENDELIRQASFLSKKYDLIVTNPPYLNSSYMEGALKQFVQKEYKSTKSDLFACFLIRCSELAKKDGLIGFICPYVWMFIKSYEELREIIIRETTISSLIQLEYNAFGPAVVPIGIFTLRNENLKGYKGSYIKLSDFRGVENQAPKTLEAIQNPDCGWFYTANQQDFEKIPGSPIGYWVSLPFLRIFESQKNIGKAYDCKSGMATCNNDRFIRLWHEVEHLDSFFCCKSHQEGILSQRKWFPYGKGGGYQKWYGNYFYFVNWKNDGKDIKNFVVNNPNDPNTTHWSRRIFNTEYFFREGITYSDVSSGDPAFRSQREGVIFSGRGPMILTSEVFILAFLNSKIVKNLLKFIAPTLTFNIGDISKIPLSLKLKKGVFDRIVDVCLNISKKNWDSRETSWDFQQNELLRIKSRDKIDLEETYDLYHQYWKNKFFQLHRNEEELNRQFIEIYGLEEELTPDVPLEEITILQQETKIENGRLVFQAKEVFAQLVSYAVGCMFGRYSVDQEGLILANQGETLVDYLEKVQKGEEELTFLPDDDNVIPVLDDEWFEDDITGRLYAFLKASFGVENFEKNLAFLEEALGKDIRRYLVKDFYPDHIKRYKKRPIYWMFSSPKGHFNVLIYLHRYTPDTLSNILNHYLREFIEKLKVRREHLEQLQISGTAREQNQALKDMEKLDQVLLDCRTYEREILFPLATERIAIDLDDGVLVNYNKFGTAIKPVKGLNDKKTKDKVRGFDWIDTSQIR